MKKLLVAVVMVAGAGAGSAARGSASDSGGTAWLHVRVEESGKGSKVSVNLPLPVVEAVLKAAPETIESEGHIHFGHRSRGRDMKLSDVRQAWRDLRAAGDTDLVTVEEDDGGTMTVGRRGDQVQVRVREHGDREQVAVDLPVAVVDALFSGTGEELNIRGALDELRKVRGHIVSVTDHDSRVRVWIDDDSSSQGAR